MKKKTIVIVAISLALLWGICFLLGGIHIRCFVHYVSTEPRDWEAPELARLLDPEAAPVFSAYISPDIDGGTIRTLIPGMLYWHSENDGDAAIVLRTVDNTILQRYEGMKSITFEELRVEFPDGKTTVTIAPKSPQTHLLDSERWAAHQVDLGFVNGLEFTIVAHGYGTSDDDETIAFSMRRAYRKERRRWIELGLFRYGGV